MRIGRVSRDRWCRNAEWAGGFRYLLSNVLGIDVGEVVVFFYVWFVLLIPLPVPCLITVMYFEPERVHE